MTTVEKIAAAIEKWRGKGGAGKLIAVVLAVIGVAVFAFVRRRDKRELAKLRHERFVNTVEKQLLEGAHQRAATLNEHVQLEAEIAATTVRLQTLDEEIQDAEDRYLRSVDAIDRIRSWDDVRR